MRNPDQHDGSGARRRRTGRSTSTTPRVLTDAAARRRVPPAASGSVPARGARLSGHPRPAAAAAGALAYGDGVSVRQRFPTRRRPRRVRAGRTALHHRVQPEPDTEHSSTDDHEGEPMCDDSRTTTHADRDTPSSGAASRRSSSARAANGSRSYSRATSRSSSASSCAGTPMRRPPVSSATGGGRRAGPGDEARRPAPGVPACPRRGLRALERHLPAVRRCLRPATRR